MTKKIILLIFIAFISINGFAQKTEELRKIGRTKYYVYQVQKGSTLYAISKVYSVSIEEIILANPGVENGLNIGDEILIPVKEVDKKEAKENPPSIMDGQLIHTVVKGETLYGISQKYKVSVEELTKNNPQLAAGLQPGMQLVINQQSISDLEISHIEPALPSNYIIHEVKTKETLYGISKMYNISINELVEINPELSNGLKEGMVLNIPKTESESSEFNQDTLVTILVKPERKKSYKVALFLPFYLNEADSAILKSQINYTIPTFNSYSLASVEFYNGFLMALDSLKKKGLNIELHVYDVNDNMINTRSVLLKPELKEMDLFIGPFHFSSFQLISDFAKKEQIKIVSPINHPNKILLNNKFVLETEASDYTQVRETVFFLKDMPDDANILMLSNFDYKCKPLCDEFEKQARGVGLSYKTVSVEFSEKDFNLIVPKNLEVKLDSNKVNRIVVISSDEGYISRLFDRMNSIDTSLIDIEIYGLNSWLKINQINTRYKVKYKVTLPVSHFINYKDKELNDFILNYLELNNTVPAANGFAFLGFDIAYFHLNELLQHGSNFEQYFTLNIENEGLQSIFRYDQVQDLSGYENKGLYFVRYEGFELIRIGDNKSSVPVKYLMKVDKMPVDSIPVDSIPVESIPYYRDHQ
jgi:LysM repeat protein